MTSAAKPFDFSDFAVTEPEAPEAAFNAADLDAARAEARAAAIDELIAKETEKQTQLLAQISEQLNAASTADKRAVADHIKRLTDTSREIVTKLCIESRVADNANSALALLDEFLTKSGGDASCVIAVSAQSSATTITELKKGLDRRGVGDVVRVETRDFLAEGEARLDWPGGALANTHAELTTQIKNIFAGMTAADRKRKG